MRKALAAVSIGIALTGCTPTYSDGTPAGGAYPTATVTITATPDPVATSPGEESVPTPTDPNVGTAAPTRKPKPKPEVPEVVVEAPEYAPGAEPATPEPTTLMWCITAALNDADIWRCGRKFGEDNARLHRWVGGVRVLIVPSDCSALPTATERDECDEDTYDNERRGQNTEPAPTATAVPVVEEPAPSLTAVPAP